MVYLKDQSIEWHPVNRPELRVPAVVTENQRTEESLVAIKLTSNGQLLAVLPAQLSWTGHEFEENGHLGAKPVPPGPPVELPMPVKLALAAKDAIVAESVDAYTNPLGGMAFGFTADLARCSAAAVVEALAVELLAQRCCPADSVVCCSSCLVLTRQAADLQALAQQVRDVPAREVA